MLSKRAPLSFSRPFFALSSPPRQARPSSDGYRVKAQKQENTHCSMTPSNNTLGCVWLSGDMLTDGLDAFPWQVSSTAE